MIASNNTSFVLDAGAGSGKTWTLIQALKYLIKEKSSEFAKNNQKIACITYTNNAKNEILDRIEHNKLVQVDTIHEFIWSCIKSYKQELRIKFLEYLDEEIKNNEEELAKKKNTTTKTYQKISERIEKLQQAKNSVEENKAMIVYKEYNIYEKGIISHDEVLIFFHLIKCSTNSL